MIDPKEDGITHINIYSKGNTILGKLLSNFALTPFTHPIDGKFNSIEGYWYWLSTGHEKLRKYYGWQAKKFGQEVGGEDWLDNDEFKFQIKSAILCKLTQTPDLLELFKQSALPFTHYYVFNDKIIEPKEGKWIIEFFEGLRKLLI